MVRWHALRLAALVGGLVLAVGLASPRAVHAAPEAGLTAKRAEEIMVLARRIVEKLWRLTLSKEGCMVDPLGCPKGRAEIDPAGEPLLFRQGRALDAELLPVGGRGSWRKAGCEVDPHGTPCPASAVGPGEPKDRDRSSDRTQ